MIEFSSTVVQILSNPTIEAFYLVDVDSGLYRTTSFFRDVTLSNGVTYASDGKLISVDPPQLSSTVDREIYKIALADPNFTLGSASEIGLIGKLVEVRIGFVNQATNLPETNILNTIIVYKGAIDGTSFNVNTASIGEVTLNITCSSPMADLDLRRPIYTTKDSIRSKDPSDTSFDQIYEGSGQLQLKWGKV
jgi:hypothetical protein